jgi:hypothetical protein
MWRNAECSQQSDGRNVIIPGNGVIINEVIAKKNAEILIINCYTIQSNYYNYFARNKEFPIVRFDGYLMNVVRIIAT